MCTAELFSQGVDLFALNFTWTGSFPINHSWHQKLQTLSYAVNLRRARLVMRWVTVSGVQSPVWENLSQYITSHPGQLSLAIPPGKGRWCPAAGG